MASPLGKRDPKPQSSPQPILAVTEKKNQKNKTQKQKHADNTPNVVSTLWKAQQSIFSGMATRFFSRRSIYSK